MEDARRSPQSAAIQEGGLNEASRENGAVHAGRDQHQRAAQRIPLIPCVYAGVEAGSGKRTAVIDRDQQASGVKVSDRGLSYGLFAGLELPLPPLLFIGAETEVGRTRARPDAMRVVAVQLPQAVLIGVQQNVRLDPRWSFGGTARFGVSPLPGLGLYGLGGYTSEHVRISRSTLVAPLPGSQPTSQGADSVERHGVTYGGGARYRFGHFGLRAEYRRTATGGGYRPAQIMGGVFFAL